jgi:hypothetical protein
MAKDWWWELAEGEGDPWGLGFDEPASRVLWRMDRSTDPPDFQPLKDLLRRLRREGIPMSAHRIRASVPLFKLEAGEFRIQVQLLEDRQALCVTRVRYGDTGRKFIRRRTSS